MLSFGEAVSTCFKKYATFTGRARRSEYWWFGLFNCIIGAVLSILLCIVAVGATSDPYSSGSGVAVAFIVLLITVVYLGLLIPSLAVFWRRLHDTGHSGWWIFISLIPIVGSIVLLVFMCSDSQLTTNQYGPSPKYE